ncbi:class I SAM-dependent methyltransferase [Accumulibacter sp.]|uniref:class I SAM-dependent methyltransferase n=1 Tax=Accumulibacter sp. TaxID=2053492 RepID=UPI0025F2D6B0|nr:class I SAM-dependent methyltransferase [Accumulibacter sp.]MCM8613023.1 class I SAM-dependent methyltransferase [Accumulibacter sp.]MCM8636777.1 class I SAM-dependent methyltransferase [Accumulibacter sp.]MCM8640428.1 class I SAM-dependent methyltransferase [Accumulibacter sp.]
MERRSCGEPAGTTALRPYELASARLRAIYQLPTMVAGAGVLELYLRDHGRVVDGEWPARQVVSCRLVGGDCGSPVATPMIGRLQGCEASYDEALPFPAASFDLVILHHTLDDLAAALPQRHPRQVAEEWLVRIASILRPGGVVAGCGRNRSSPRSWHWRRREVTPHAPEVAALSMLSCQGALLSAGFSDIQVCNLWPHPQAPSTIAAVEVEASRRAFRYALESSRDSLGVSGYLLRRAVVELGLNRFFEPYLFYWGFRSC